MAESLASRNSVLIAAVVALLCAPTARGAAFEARTFRAAGGDVMPYQLFVPERYDGKRVHPLVVWLHGSAGRGEDNRRQISEGNSAGATVWTTPAHQKRYGAIVVAPQCPSDEMWTSIRPVVKPARYLRYVVQLVRELQRNYRIDPRRIYVAGQSMGGYGAWALATSYPDLFAAAVPICGGGNEPDAIGAKEVAVWAFHGELDRAVPVERSRKMVAAMRKAGARVRYTEYAGAGHAVWNHAFAEPELLPWLFAQRR